MSLSASRRRLLQAALLSPVVAACTRNGPRPAPVDPDDALRRAAVARERALVESYQAAAASSSSAVAAAIGPMVAEHTQHLATLGAGSPAPSPSSPPTAPLVPTLAQLAAAERAAAAEHAADALRASRPLAAVLASLAASEASHPVALLP
jgi:hypothetical protein